MKETAGTIAKLLAKNVTEEKIILSTESVSPDFKTISNEGLITRLRAMIADERKITLQILHLINEAYARRLYADFGFPSLFEWLTKDLGYSAAAAMRRIESARALRDVPAIEKKIESGELNLTNLAKVQCVIRAEEKRTGERLSAVDKAKTFQMIEQKSSREAEQILVSAFPEAAKVVSKPESVRTINESEVRVEVTFTKQQLAKLNRVREVVSHSHFGSSLAEIIDLLAGSYLEKNDPLLREIKPRPKTNSIKKSSSSISTHSSLPAPETNRIRHPLAPSLRNAVIRKADGRCQFIDSKTEYRCESRQLLEIDHIAPVSLGGTNDSRNLRVLCRTHNLAAAEKMLGKDVVQNYRQIF